MVLGLLKLFVHPRVQRKYSGPNVEVTNGEYKSCWCVGDIRDGRVPGNNDGTEQRDINTEDILGGKTLPRKSEAIEKEDMMLLQIQEKILLNNSCYISNLSHKNM